MFDWKKPTVQMLGRWQPWHKGHRELFKRCISKTGQVIIQVRDIQGSSGGLGQDDNPFEYESKINQDQKVNPDQAFESGSYRSDDEENPF